MIRALLGGGLRHSLVFFLAVLLVPLNSARAGMTVYGLNDVYRLRLESISFLLLIFVICTYLVKVLWNVLAKELDFLPRMRFKHAAAFSTLLGLGMLLILTMISGIREVLTPEAWRRQGSAYRLNAPVMEEERRWHIQQLAQELSDYATAHDGALPPHDFVPEIPFKVWVTPDPKRSRYFYRGGANLKDSGRIVAWEPPHFGETLFVVLNTGEVQQRPAEEVGKAAEQRLP